MKFFALFLLATSVGLAADLSTGQAARLLIGQTTFTLEASGASQTLLGAVGGVAFANNTLFVADANRVGALPVNNRVLIYANLSSMIPGPTDMLEATQRCPACVGTASVVLGQPDFTTTDLTIPPTSLTLRTPSAVASDGVRLAIADSDNNRVLLYNSIPTSNKAAPDVVLGQTDFTSAGTLKPPTASSLRGPQGVWFQNGKLFVADTFNNRVLIWNRIPTANGTPADVVLGQANFTAFPENEPSIALANVKATTLFSPTSVTSDGVRLYVTDLGYDRVLIWNSIPTTNLQPADVVIGQPDMTSSVTNNSPKMCASNGTDTDGNATYPVRCGGTLNTPRFALSDGQRLFIADGGNDRVLVFNSVPSANGQAADVVLGQQTMEGNVSGSSFDPLPQSSADSLRTPMSLAWDGTNLYVADTFNRRIMVFTVAEPSIPYAGVRNSASRAIHSLGAILISGSIQEKDKLTVKIGETEYVYTVIENDTLANVVTQVVNLINAGDGDPLVYASPNLQQQAVILTARGEGVAGNDITYSVTLSDTPLLAASVAGPTLSGGNDAAKIAPGTLVEILGEGLAEQVAVASLTEQNLPTQMAGVQFYVDGIRSPLLYVSPTQINAQIPFEVADASSVNAYVRVEWSDGRVTVTNPVAVPIIPQNPGIFGYEGPEPRPAVALHSSSQATGTISVDGTAAPSDLVAITIEDRKYSLYGPGGRHAGVHPGRAGGAGEPGSQGGSVRLRALHAYPASGAGSGSGGQRNQDRQRHRRGRFGHHFAFQRWALLRQRGGESGDSGEPGVTGRNDPHLRYWTRRGQAGPGPAGRQNGIEIRRARFERAAGVCLVAGGGQDRQRIVHGDEERHLRSLRSTPRAKLLAADEPFDAVDHRPGHLREQYRDHPRL